VAERPTPADARRLSGLPTVEVLSDPARVSRVRRVAARAGDSPVLKGLVTLAGRVAGSDCAQLSLLADRQVATAVRCAEAAYSEQVSDLADSLCTITVLSGDVLVAADARTHPWLLDLPPVTSGVVGCSLGVPLRLADGTAIGALCVYGPDPRDWTDRHVGLTCDVADIVAAELERLGGP
jgi:GAF domain-containing protein